MRDSLIHRGPDDAGLHVAGSVGLGARRLAIIDLTAAGHQPMVVADGNLWIVFNGEIYNYRRAARGLEAQGARSAPASDTEVLLHALRRGAQRCVQRLNGMFAFALWDRARGAPCSPRATASASSRSTIIRTAQRFLFASEAKALGADGIPTLARADHEAVADYLFCRQPAGRQDRLRRDVQASSSPGHSLTWRRGTNWKIRALLGHHVPIR